MAAAVIIQTALSNFGDGELRYWEVVNRCYSYPKEADNKS